MPGYDMTGPRGFGPRTGRGFGPCGGNFAKGKGWRNWQRPAPELTLTKEEQKKVLKEELDCLEAEIRQIKEKLKELR